MAVSEDSNKTRLLLIGLAVLVVGAVVVFALFQNSSPPPAQAAASATPGATPGPALSQPSHASPAVAAATPVTHVAAPDNSTAPWENTIDQVLRSNASETQMAQLLINILPTLPEDGQIEAANHITNLLPDNDYKAVRPLLLNPSLPESVLSVFFTDLMNRDDPTKLNSFLDIAQMPNHPFHDEALSDLQIYIGDDYGTDWGKWKSGVAEYLKNASEQ